LPNGRYLWRKNKQLQHNCETMVTQGSGLLHYSRICGVDNCESGTIGVTLVKLEIKDIAPTGREQILE